jgi:HD-GYP domain-containing protein (c-di-GMP phosphodiesterase class II)
MDKCSAVNNKPTMISEQATETIDLSQLIGEGMTESGSFAVLGQSSKIISNIFDALPIPILCINKDFVVQFANKSCAKITLDFQSIVGKSILNILPREKDVRLIKSSVEATFATRQSQKADGAIQMDSGYMWGRFHFRSLRVLGVQLVLVQIEDLTYEKKQIVLRVKHHKELQKSIGEVKQELKQRHQVERALKDSLAKFKTTLDGVLKSLATLVERKDPYTAGHQLRVARLSTAIAKQMGLPADQIRGINIAASMHDIGKVCVPAELLSKPGRLNEHEYGIIRAHPEIGYDILKGVEFPWPFADIALQHHERMNGSGYPRGLKGDAIRIESRIVAVADVVEAMLSHRPYRPKLPLKEAIKELQDNRGTLYDSDVVDACLIVLRRLSDWVQQKKNKKEI